MKITALPLAGRPSSQPLAAGLDVRLLSSVLKARFPVLGLLFHGNAEHATYTLLGQLRVEATQQANSSKLAFLCLAFPQSYPQT